ncbi:hypothetical protein [Halarchaeum sp. P4]|uniref:hypothetical protein n=1 Tax=Halarchaeum sp. P4 TaxID=3421639 RepID=UPI003EBCC636
MRTPEKAVDSQQFIDNLRNFQYREVMMSLATLAVVAGSIFLFPGWANVTKGIQSSVTTDLLILFVVVAVVAGAIKGMLGFGYLLAARESRRLRRA